MGNKRITGIKRLLLFAVIHMTFCLGSLCANDPFEGNFFSPDCIKRRPITGCPNETLLSIYKKSGLSKSDQNRNEADTRLYLFTPCNQKKAEFLHECGGRVPENTNFRPGEKTVIIIGGYISPMCSMTIFREMKYQFLCRPEFHNVVLVDWFWGNGVDYFSARINTEIVAKQLALFLSIIMDQTRAPPENFHIVGHSLGAQIAGCTSEVLQTMGKGKIGRISGLDPAAPGYLENQKCSISKDDAQIVDIIHSNAGPCFPFALGIPWNAGHADFYPNGGSFQPSYYVSFAEALKKGDFYYALVLALGPFGPHFMSVQYFKESINACKCEFVGVNCTHEKYKAGECTSCGPDGSKCQIMGYGLRLCGQQNESNSYFLKTGLRCPTCNNNGIDLGGFSTTPTKCGKPISCFNRGENCPDHNC